MSRLALPICVCLLACQPDQQVSGTAVGNPTQGLTARTSTHSSIQALRGTMPVDTASLVACDGTERPLASGIDLDLAGGSRLELPTGDWCTVRLDLSAPLQLDGRDTQGRTFALTLDVARVRVRTTTPFDTGATSLIVSLGPNGFLSSDALGLNDTPDLVLGPGDDGHDDLVDQIEQASLLIADRDGDGERDADDDVLARGDDDGSDDDTDDTDDDS